MRVTSGLIMLTGMLKEAGADRYLLRFDTPDPHLLKRLKPDSASEKRFQCRRWLTELGCQVGTGSMVGLPGQSVESVADDILKFKELELDMVGLGPFIPHPDTPLRDSDGGTIDLVLRVTELTRIATKNAHMPATTATGTLDPQGRKKALQCGANVFKPNLTTPLSLISRKNLYQRRIRCMSLLCGRYGQQPGTQDIIGCWTQPEKISTTTRTTD